MHLLATQGVSAGGSPASREGTLTVMSTKRYTAGLAALVLGVLTACGADPSAPSAPPPGTTITPPAPGGEPPPPVDPQAQERALPVYYMVDTEADGLRLYREFRRVVTADPASDAVRTMLGSDRGLDPDYRSFWPAGTTLHSPVQQADGVITVDLTAQARGGPGGAATEVMSLHQLVYTVQGALQSTDPVQLLIEGEPVEELWGHVAIDEPLERADPLAVRSLVQINNPNEGVQRPRTFTVDGEAAVFEANVLWEVLQDGEVVQSGFTTTTEAFRFTPFRFELTLEPGEYVVRVMEEDASGGEGRAPFEDTKRIQVTG